jgi:hypothetical protein
MHNQPTTHTEPRTESTAEIVGSCACLLLVLLFTILA